MIKLEAGKCYRDRRGRFYGPLSFSHGSTRRWPFYVIDDFGTMISWTKDGQHSADLKASDYDLIEEVSGIEEFVDVPGEIKLIINEKRKPIQMAVSPATKAIFALCNDGSMWVSYDKKWERVKSIPQPKNK